MLLIASNLIIKYFTRGYLPKQLLKLNIVGIERLSDRFIYNFSELIEVNKFKARFIESVLKKVIDGIEKNKNKFSFNQLIAGLNFLMLLIDCGY